MNTVDKSIKSIKWHSTQSFTSLLGYTTSNTSTQLLVFMKRALHRGLVVTIMRSYRPYTYDGPNFVPLDNFDTHEYGLDALVGAIQRLLVDEDYYTIAYHDADGASTEDVFLSLQHQAGGL